MSDYMLRGLSKEGNIRAFACWTTDLVEQAREQHQTLPTATVALGRALTCGVMMGACLKTHQRVALKFHGNGPLKKILVEAESNGSVRGYVGNPNIHMDLKKGRFDIPGAIGKAGLLTVVKDLLLKEPYSGTVLLYSGEIAEDLAYYLTTSEQIPSAVSLGVYLEQDGGVSSAGGYMVQALPPSDSDIIEQMADRIGKMSPVTQMLRKGQRPEEMLDLVFADIPYTVLENRPLRLECACSRKRMEQALILLGRKEIRDLMNGDGPLEITCDFCRRPYLFSMEDLERLSAQIH